MSQPSRARRIATVTGLSLASLVLVLILALVIDYLVLASRPQQLPLTMPSSQQGTTWVIIGLDDRSTVAEKTGKDVGNGKGAPPGARADVIIVVHQTAARTTALTITRDLVVRTPEGVPNRLANTWLISPQNFVDTLCREVGIPTTHLVTVNMRAFVSLVDAIGGVQVTLPQALRDSHAKINLPAGPQRLDGRTALGLVRSRQGEVLVDGRWQAEANGATGRQRRAAQVLQAALSQARSAGPIALQTAAWRTLPDVGLSSGTSLASLRALRSLPAPTPLPADENEEAALATMTGQTTAALEQAGFSGGCTAG